MNEFTDQVETARLLMRPFTMEDADGIFELDSDPRVLTYLGNHVMKNRQEAVDDVAHILQQYRDYGIGRWAVIEKSTGAFIGWSGLKYVDFEIAGMIHFYDVGYRFIPRYWGKGYATESARASLQYAFETKKWTEVWAMADINNQASNHILEHKLGMQKLDTFLFDGASHYKYYLSLSDYTHQKMTWDSKPL